MYWYVQNNYYIKSWNADTIKLVINDMFTYKTNTVPTKDCIEDIRNQTCWRQIVNANKQYQTCHCKQTLSNLRVSLKKTWAIGHFWDRVHSHQAASILRLTSKFNFCSESFRTLSWVKYLTGLVEQPLQIIFLKNLLVKV